MKQLINVIMILSIWAMHVDAVPTEQLDSIENVCDLLNSFSADGEMLTRFNGIFFNDFKTGKDFRSQGPLSIGGSFIGDNAFINQRNQLSCASGTRPPEISHHGLILKGTTNSSITVNGFVNSQVENSKIKTPLNECSVHTAATSYDFELTKLNAIRMSRHFAKMLPNWSIDKMGIIVKIVPEGISVEQPYHIFTMPAKCGAGPYQAKNYFACANNHDCETPAQTLSDGHAMFLGKTSHWTGPIQQKYPQDNLVIFNIPVMEGQTYDIQTKNPSAGLNACNTIYNFYAVNRQGRFEPNGSFTLKRSSENSLHGMILAPQAHIIDNATGSFAGQVIADSYESADDGVQIFDYQSAGGEQCQIFTGCVTKKAKRLIRRQTGNTNAGSSVGVDQVATERPTSASGIFVTDVTVSPDSTLSVVDKVIESKRPITSATGTTKIEVNGPRYRHTMNHWESGKNHKENREFEKYKGKEEKKEWQEKDVNPDGYDKTFKSNEKQSNEKRIRI